MLSGAVGFSRALAGRVLPVGVQEMAKDVLWVGTIDWDIREFHSLHIPKGTSYNSYFIEGGVPTVVESVKDTLGCQWIAKLKQVGGDNLSGIKQIVLNHAEPDHTSAMKMLMAKFPHIELVCTKRNIETLSRFYDTSKWKVKVVKGGETFQAGNKKMQLIEVPLAHWPESCVSYVAEDKLMFSNDVFGQHIAGNQRWVDEIDEDLYLHESKAYYGNILLRLKKPVLSALKAAGTLPGIDTILTAHGVSYRRPEDIARIIKLYSKWANQAPSPKIMVLYDCNWYGTEKMAAAIASGAATIHGVDIKMYHARRTHITEVATEIVDCPCLALGSPVLHDDVLPDMATHMSYLRCLGIRNKAGALFGTYGWTKEAAVKQMRAQLFEPTKTQEIREPILIPWSPKRDDLHECELLGIQLAAEALKKSKEASH